jgi:hypothetical protein
MKHACRLDILKGSGEILAATTDSLRRKDWLIHDTGLRDLQYSTNSRRSGKTEYETYVLKGYARNTRRTLVGKRFINRIWKTLRWIKWKYKEIYGGCKM